MPMARKLMDYTLSFYPVCASAFQHSVVMILAHAITQVMVSRYWPRTEMITKLSSFV